VTAVPEPTGPELRPIGRFEWERLLRRIPMAPQAKLVALVLSTYADPDGSRVRPGQGALASVSGFGERTVRRLVHQLRDEHRLIEQTMRGGGRGGRGRTTEYRLTVPVDLLDRVQLLAPADHPTVSPATQTAGQSEESPAPLVAAQSEPSPVDNSESPAIQVAAQSDAHPVDRPDSPATQVSHENNFQGPPGDTSQRLTGQTGPIDRPPGWPTTTHIPTTKDDQPPTGLPTQPPDAHESRTDNGQPRPRWAPGPPDRRADALADLLAFTPTVRRPPPPSTQDPP